MQAFRYDLIAPGCCPLSPLPALRPRTPELKLTELTLTTSKTKNDNSDYQFQFILLSTNKIISL